MNRLKRGQRSPKDFTPTGEPRVRRFSPVDGPMEPTQRVRWVERDANARPVDLSWMTFCIPLSDQDWVVTGSWSLTESAGIELCDIHVRPAPVNRDGQMRSWEDIPHKGIDSSVMRSVNVGEIRARIVKEYQARFERDIERFESNMSGGIDASGLSMPELVRLFRLPDPTADLEAQYAKRTTKGGRPRLYDSTDYALWAEAVLVVATETPARFREALAERWGVSTRTVGGRLTQLRREHWLEGKRSEICAGPRLIKHRREREE